MTPQGCPSPTLQPRQLLRPNFQEGGSSHSSSPEQLHGLISELAKCRDLVQGMVFGTPVRQCIRHILEATINSKHQEQQYNFVHAVVKVILNLGRAESGTPERQPKHGQVESIRRIIYRLGDTILVAKTGYGKTIVLQTVSVIMEDRVTLQLIPLSRLGEDQLQSIARIPGARPLLLSDETVKVCTLVRPTK